MRARKVCSKCRIEKRIFEFCKIHKTRKFSERRSICNKCVRENKRRPYDRDADRESRTGWSKLQFLEAWELQNGSCGICGIKMKSYGRSRTSVAADHCHFTGVPRGLLCSYCNKFLGHIEANLDKLGDYIDYLVRFDSFAIDL